MLTSRQRSALDTVPALAKGRSQGIALADHLDALAALAGSSMLVGQPNGTSRFPLAFTPQGAEHAEDVSAVRYWWPTAPSSAAGTFTAQLMVWDDSAGAAAALGAAENLEAHVAGWNEQAAEVTLEAGDVLYVELVSNNVDLANAFGLAQVVFDV